MKVFAYRQRKPKPEPIIFFYTNTNIEMHIFKLLLHSHSIQILFCIWLCINVNNTLTHTCKRNNLCKIKSEFHSFLQIFNIIQLYVFCLKFLMFMYLQSMKLFFVVVQNCIIWTNNINTIFFFIIVIVGIKKVLILSEKKDF